MDGESVIEIADLARAGTPTFEYAGRLFARDHTGVPIEVTPKNHWLRGRIRNVPVYV